MFTIAITLQLQAIWPTRLAKKPLLIFVIFSNANFVIKCKKVQVKAHHEFLVWEASKVTQSSVAEATEVDEMQCASK